MCSIDTRSESPTIEHAMKHEITITVRLTKAENAAIERCAKAASMLKSAWLRHVAMKEVAVVEGKRP